MVYHSMLLPSLPWDPCIYDYIILINDIVDVERSSGNADVLAVQEDLVPNRKYILNRLRRVPGIGHDAVLLRQTGDIPAGLTHHIAKASEGARLLGQGDRPRVDEGLVSFGIRADDLGADTGRLLLEGGHLCRDLLLVVDGEVS